jgi:exonuclease SbcC
MEKKKQFQAHRLSCAPMIERIAVQVRVEKCGAGRSEIRIATAMGTTLPAIGAMQ